MNKPADLMLMACAIAFTASVPRGLADSAVEVFDGYVAAARADWEIPGLAVAVVKDGKVVLSKGYGVRLMGSSDAVDADTLFAIGSTTKAMTAAGLGLLVEAEKLGWDDRVIDRWPEFRMHDPYVTREVTVRDLLTHRAGLGNADGLWYGMDRPRAEILSRIRLIEPAYSLRDGFTYQNIMYIAAGDLSARLAEQPWEAFITERLFKPLGMRRTAATTTLAQSRSNVAAPHARIDGAIEAIENEPVDELAPAGAVWSSAAEMARWVRMLLSKGELDGVRVLSAETVAELLRPAAILDISGGYPYVDRLGSHWNTYALGWFQLDYNGRAVSFHTGSIDGMTAIVGMIPDEQLGIVVLQNLGGANLRHALMWKCFDLFAGENDGRDWSKELRAFYGEREQKARKERSDAEAARRTDTKTSLPLESYAGRYEHPLYGEIEVVQVENGLRLRIGPRLAGVLEHWQFDTFQVRFDRRWQGSGLVPFTLDATGKIASMKLRGEDFGRVRDAE